MVMEPRTTTHSSELNAYSPRADSCTTCTKGIGDWGPSLCSRSYNKALRNRHKSTRSESRTPVYGTWFWVWIFLSEYFARSVCLLLMSTVCILFRMMCCAGRFLGIHIDTWGCPELSGSSTTPICYSNHNPIRNCGVYWKRTDSVFCSLTVLPSRCPESRTHAVATMWLYDFIQMGAEPETIKILFSLFRSNGSGYHSSETLMWLWHRGITYRTRTQKNAAIKGPFRTWARGARLYCNNSRNVCGPKWHLFRI